MKQYYLCDIIGDGSEENAYRPAVSDHSVSWVGSIPSDPVTGHPISTWALVLVATNNHAKLRNKPGIDALPDFPMDGKVSAINTATKNAMNLVLERRSIPTGLFGNADGYRDVIRGIGRQIDPAFDENNFDVAE
ncbi:MAG: hypothetical protein JJD98_00170 [Polaromonas sp.]|nr:hypothetical protein [Polaromonas sp.]